ncbi:MAG: ABC transporter permease, partial [Bacteroidales bacterium]|nr:ABC transporter permease [Bacteroidales bacterium]
SLIAIPLGIHSGIEYSVFTADMLNFEIINSQIPYSVILFQLVVSLLLPLLLTFLPVLRASRISIKETLDDYGVKGKAFSTKPTSFKLFRTAGFSKIFLFALRNTFRRKTRLILTLIILVLGGSIFITSFNIRKSINSTVQTSFDQQKYEVQVKFVELHKENELKKILSNIKDIKKVEFWNYNKTTRSYDSGLESRKIDIKAVKLPSTLFVAEELLDGTWLKKGNEGVVINHELLGDEPDLKIGAKLKLNLNGLQHEFEIIGITRELFQAPTVYIDYDYYSMLTGQKDMAGFVLIDVEEGSLEKTVNIIEQKLDEAGFGIDILLRKDIYKQLVVDHLIVVTSMLVIMTFVIIFVGGFGLITTMGINVVERKRELGILRAIGVTDKSLFKILIYEGLTIGLISWFFSIALSIPVSWYLGDKFFHIFFDTTINFMYSPIGFIVWLLVVIIFSYSAIIFPARNATRMSVNEALAYE